MKEYLEKYYDLFGLNFRIKKIDLDYELLLNKKNNRLEIHNFKQPFNSFVCFAEPLDNRLIEKLIKTRVVNSKNFFDEIEKFNDNLKEKNLKSLLNKVSDINKEIANYSFIKNRNLTSKEIQKIIKN